MGLCCICNILFIIIPIVVRGTGGREIKEIEGGIVSQVRRAVSQAESVIQEEVGEGRGFGSYNLT
jgi:hypothetical protein